MTKISHIFFLLLLTICIHSNNCNLIRYKRNNEKYTTKYDNLDVDRILMSKRLIINYINCLLDKGPCSADGNELKRLLPEALTTNCVKCSDVQKKQAGKILEFLIRKYRPEFDQLTDKYDPDGNFRKQYGFDEEDYDYSQLDEA